MTDWPPDPQLLHLQHGSVGATSQEAVQGQSPLCKHPEQNSEHLPQGLVNTGFFLSCPEPWASQSLPGSMLRMCQRLAREQVLVIGVLCLVLLEPPSNAPLGFRTTVAISVPPSISQSLPPSSPLSSPDLRGRPGPPASDSAVAQAWHLPGGAMASWDPHPYQAIPKVDKGYLYQRLGHEWCLTQDLGLLDPAA